MSLVSSLRSQANNIRNFRELFPLGVLARNLVTLPLDRLRGDGRAAPPMVINLGVTTKCGLNCAMCTARELRSQRLDEMTPGDIEQLARQTSAFKPAFFLGGGEPFMRRDFEDIVGVLKRHDLRVGVVTNGVQVTPSRGEALKKLGLDSMLVSLHGPREVHDTITGVPGAFDRALEHIRAFCRPPRRTRVMINFVMSKTNIAHVRELVELGRQAGADRVRVEHMLFMTAEDQALHDAWCQTHLADGRERADLRVSTYVCEPAVVSGFADDLPRVLRELEREYGGFLVVKPNLDPNEVAAWYQPGYRAQRRCLFVWRSLFLKPDGDVIPCQHYGDMVLGNARRQPLLDIWNNERYRRLRLMIGRELPPGCSRCCKT
jgi:MoaA/NifB/PqqE/SkfB family radical SAM enzyme